VQGRVAFSDVANVVFVGFGDMAAAASLAQAWPDFSQPSEILNGYELPSYANHDTLVIVLDNTGDPGMLDVLDAAGACDAQVAVISPGNALWRSAEAHDYPRVLLPPNVTRYGMVYAYRALLEIMAVADIISAEVVATGLDTAANNLSQATAQWRPDVSTSQNAAKQLAQELMGKSVAVYAGPKMYPAASYWKNAVNQNAKQIAWSRCFPDASHTDLAGWSKQPTGKPYAVIELHSPLEHIRVQKDFAVNARLLSGMRPEAHVIEVQGTTIVEQLSWAVAFGDFVTLYLALLQGLNPSTHDLLEKYKKELEL